MSCTPYPFSKTLFAVFFYSSSFLLFFLSWLVIFYQQNHFLHRSGATRTWPSCAWATDTHQHSVKNHLLKISRTRAPTWRVCVHVCSSCEVFFSGIHHLNSYFCLILLFFWGGGRCMQTSTGGLITFPLLAAEKDGNICILNSINPVEPSVQIKITKN